MKLKLSGEGDRDPGGVADVWLLHHAEDHPNFRVADLQARWWAEPEYLDTEPEFLDENNGIDLFVELDGDQALALRLMPPAPEPETPLRLVLQLVEAGQDRAKTAI